MGMSNWMTMAGMAGMLVWLGPTCTAMAQCGTSCGSTPQDHGQRAERPGERSSPDDAGVARLPSCPVTGEPIDFNVKTTTSDGPIYFSRESCIEKYEKDPAKYAKKAEMQRAALKKMERVQTTCPVTGNPIDGKAFAMIEGQGVSFCCADCIGKYEENPKKYGAALEASYSYQTRCPVMGGKIDPKSYTDLPTGERVYFCCPGCEGKLLANPEKYALKLAAQGINVGAEKVSGKSGDRMHAEGEHDHP